MLFYRDETIDDPNACCPICSGELKKCFFFPMLHDSGAAIRFLFLTLAMSTLTAMVAHQLTVLTCVDIPPLPRIGCLSETQLGVLLCLLIGAVLAHLLLLLLPYAIDDADSLPPSAEDA